MKIELLKKKSRKFLMDLNTIYSKNKNKKFDTILNVLKSYY